MSHPHLAGANDALQIYLTHRLMARISGAQQGLQWYDVRMDVQPSYLWATQAPA